MNSFWSSAEQAEWTFTKAKDELKRCKIFQYLKCFKLDPKEADFLLKQLKMQTPYLNDLSTSKLRSLVNAEEIALLDVKEALRSEPHKKIFEAAHYINQATSPFRVLYDVRARQPNRVGKLNFSPEPVRIAFDWLNKHGHSANPDWHAAWTAEIMPLINSWLTLHKQHGFQRMLEALCSRAEEVVAIRRQSKKPPHVRFARNEPDDEEELHKELGVRESSFRLHNGTVILRDVLSGVGS